MTTERTSPAARETLIETGTASLFVREIGRGRTMVVLHGGPEFDHSYFVPELDGLADAYRLIYYDQRGRGRSFNGEEPDGVTIASEIDDLERVRQWSGADAMAVLGHSWGTVLALEYAIRHPERVSHLILIGAAPASRADRNVLTAGFAAVRMRAEVARMLEVAAEPAYAEGDRALADAYSRIHFRPAVRRPEHLQLLIPRLRQWSSPESIVAARAIEDHLYEETWNRDDWDLAPALSALRIPTLLLHGESDFIPLEVAQTIAHAIPGARLEVIADAGHFPFLEQPDRVRMAIESFIPPQEGAS